MKNNALWVVILILVLIYISQSNNQPKNISSSISNETSLVDLVDADVSFTGKDKYVPGTGPLSGEVVRVFKLTNGRLDLGTISLNSGALSVTPNIDYRFYFFMNKSVPSTNYYVDVHDYTAKVQDSIDNVVGVGCLIDTLPKVSVRNPDGVAQSSRSNAYSLGASTTADFEVSILAHTDKCYGTPKSPKGNIICFGYNTTEFSTITANTNWVSAPRSIFSLAKNADQTGLICFSFDLVENGNKDTITIQATSNKNPVHNITIFTDDIGFDLHQNTLAEIWDYVDENGNQLGRVINATPDGYIYIS